jgi:hypothetical protein
MFTFKRHILPSRVECLSYKALACRICTVPGPLCRNFQCKTSALYMSNIKKYSKLNEVLHSYCPVKLILLHQKQPLPAFKEGCVGVFMLTDPTSYLFGIRVKNNNLKNQHLSLFIRTCSCHPISIESV